MRTMSGKVKWEIGLLVVWMVLGFGQMVQNSGSASFLLVIVVLMECLPTIAVIVLTHYDHKYAAPKNGTFTLLRVWALALIWLQPVLSLLSYIAAGAFTSFILGVWVASCLFPLIAFILLFVDGKSGQVTTHGSKIHLTDTPATYEKGRKLVRDMLLKRSVYYFSEKTIDDLYNKSLLQNQLDMALLDINISDYHQKIKYEQDRVANVINQLVNLYHSDFVKVLISACAFDIERHPNDEELLAYIRVCIKDLRTKPTVPPVWLS